MKLTEHFTLEEMTMSATARRYGYDNTPNKEQLANLQNLCENILEPLRKLYGKPIIVSSGYRSKQLNKQVGGAASSQHMQGKAADIRSTSDTKEDNKALFNLLAKSGLPFDQLINEYDYDWIHVSFNPIYRRKQILTCKRYGGKTFYTNVTNTLTIDGVPVKQYIK